MADRPIQVGDLVQVVKPPRCGCTTTLGLIFKVQGFEIVTGSCGTCRKYPSRDLLAESGIPSDRGTYGFEPFRLKRIPPLDELEGQRTEETLREPA